ncbi:low temperature requirement protein A [Micromonospora musae]|uniref:low temperature requirement protein A n=1 Tax=Micromonospora musae TaxID=1894970 RepID=UPI0033C44AE7
MDRLEVFFDVVFVFAFFNISRTAYGMINPVGLLQALLPLALLWRAWSAHIFVVNRVRPGEGAAPLVMFAAMAAAFLFGLSIPRAFSDEPGGLPGPLLITCCYATIRILHLLLFWRSAVGNPGLRRQLIWLVAPVIGTTAALLAAAVIPAHLPADSRNEARLALWIFALLIEYGWLWTPRMWSSSIVSAEHWVERFELIIIIAVGESIISVGIGSNLIGGQISWPVAIAAILAIAVTAALWWGYFDHIAPKVHDVMNATEGRARNALVRDAYICLHLPMVAGVILFAVGGEDMLHHLGELDVDLSIPLPGPGEVLTYGGVILFFLGHLAFQLRVLGTMAWPRVVAIALLAGMLPLVGHLPALAAMVILPGICVLLIVSEAVFLGESRLFLKQPDVRRRLEESRSAGEAEG